MGQVVSDVTEVLDYKKAKKEAKSKWLRTSRQKTIW